MQDDLNPINKADLFGGAQYDVEHALNMYATSFFTLPAKGIYETRLLEPHKHLIERCHIYMIGYLPEMHVHEVTQQDGQLKITILVHRQEHHLRWPIPSEVTLIKEESRYFLQNGTGERFWISDEEMQHAIRRIQDITFEVKYIGQAYGSDGGRSALDRLLKHETLQKISLKGLPDGCCLSLLLLEVLPDTRLITVFNPFSQEHDEAGTRIAAGIDKLFGTSEKEQVALFEASFIRYFGPEFNKEFKDSFPSTNMKVLNDCYDKDFAAVIAEICIDELPFKLCSESIAPAFHHIAQHDLHSEAKRKMFFSME